MSWMPDRRQRSVCVRAEKFTFRRSNISREACTKAGGTWVNFRRVAAQSKSAQDDFRQQRNVPGLSERNVQPVKRRRRIDQDLGFTHVETSPSRRGHVPLILKPRTIRPCTRAGKCECSACRQRQSSQRKGLHRNLHIAVLPGTHCCAGSIRSPETNLPCRMDDAAGGRKA